jgi:exopolysaccharide biosynthesis operon protein EpsL
MCVTYVRYRGIRSSRSINFRRIALALTACACVPGAAWAGPFDSIHPYMGVSESYDGNLLGISNNAEAKQILGSTNTGDWSHVEQVGISFDDQIGLQHITADVNASKGQYDRFTPLDYSAKSAQGDWNWSLGTHLNGNLGASYVESLAPYTFVHELSVNLRTQKAANADATWLFHPSWRVVGGMSATQTHYDLLAEQAEDRSEYRANVGVDYVQANDSSTGVQLVQIRGYFPYPQFYGPIGIINNYVQDELDAKIDWHFSGKSRLQFVGGWVERKHEVLTEQNYRGVNARAILDWNLTGKTSLNAAVWHEIGAVDNLTTVYSVNHGVSLAPTWSVTDKLRADLQLKIEQRAFAQSAQVFETPTSGVTYTFHNVSADVVYQPTLHWQLRGSVYYQSQSTSDHSNDFSGSGIQCGTRYQF